MPKTNSPFRAENYSYLLRVQQAGLLVCLLAFTITACFLSIPASAQSSIIIEAGDQGLRDDLEWLADRGVLDISTSTWPMPMSILENALAKRKQTGLSAGDVHALISVQQYVARQQKTSYGAIAQVNTGSIPSLNFSSQSHAAAEGGLYIQGHTDNVAGRLQVNALLDPLTNKQSQANLEGSYIGTTIFNQVIYAGQLAHWWGPGHDGSLIWSNAGTAIPGVGLRRGTEDAFKTPWLSWIGPWGYEVFVGQMQHDTAVAHPQVFNLRAYVRPIQGLELGASRFIQWAGAGRPSGLGALWKELSGNSNDVNGNDSGNEIAGFDARYTLPIGQNRLTLYSQAIGEDEAGGLPSHYLAQVGAEFKHMWGSSRVSWYAEGADTTVDRIFGLKQGLAGVAYDHITYKNGLYQDGLPIAHFIGGSGRVYSAGVTVAPADYKYYSRYSVRVLQAAVNSTSQNINQAFPVNDRFYGGEIAVSWLLKPTTVSVGLTGLRSQSGSANNSVSVLVSLNIPFAEH